MIPRYKMELERAKISIRKKISKTRAERKCGSQLWLGRLRCTGEAHRQSFRDKGIFTTGSCGRAQH